MESQISSLFSSILTTIKDYEDRTNKQIAKHDTIIQEKDQQIQVLNDLKQKQQNEMEDFLKVSYAQLAGKMLLKSLKKKMYIYKIKLNLLHEQMRN